MDNFITVTGFMLGALVIFCAAFVCSAPLKYIVRLVVNSILGCILLFAANFFFGHIGINAAINPVTAVCVGVLGIPGAIAAIILGFII